MLLKYRSDAANIVDIDWDSAKSVSSEDHEMSKQQTSEADQKAKDEADAKAKTEADQKAKDEADAKAAEDAKAKTEADQKAKDEPKKTVLPAGMTEDMLAFATSDYKVVRDGHIASIKACKGNAFSDTDLEGCTIDFLAKIVALIAKPKVDNSLIAPAPVAKGTGGTLPPPEL